MNQAKAKVFKNGRSQAVRLPQEFRFDVPEVYIRRDLKTGDVILSTRPLDWKGFIELLDGNDPHVRDFMKDRYDPPPKPGTCFD